MLPTTRTILIRSARPYDGAELLDVQQTIYDEDEWFVGDAAPDMPFIKRRLATVAARRSVYLLALCEQDICAWLELNRHLPKKLGHVAVLTLAVAKPYRREGLASRLLSQGYLEATKLGIRKISLSVRASNKAALSLYEREGFLLEGCEKAHIRTAQGFEDNLIMAKFL